MTGRTGTDRRRSSVARIDDGATDDCAAGRGRIGPLPAVAVLAAALLLPAATGGAAEAQEPVPAPSVEPGSVATVPVAATAPRGFEGRSAEFRVAGVSGIRLFGDGRGEARLEGDSVVVALTFEAAEDLAAGRRRVADLVVSWDEVAVDTLGVEVDVAARHRLEAGFVKRSATVAPGRDAEVGYRIANRGNAVDTVRLSVEAGHARGWRFAPVRPRVVVEPGATDTVAVRVRPPNDVRVGTRHRFRVVSSGGAAEAAGHTTLHVVEGGGPVPGVEHLPGHVFVGSSTSGRAGSSAGVVAAVRAEGTVAGDTELSLQGHYRPENYLTPRPLRNEVVGPEVRLRVRRPDWEAAAGDVFARSDPLAGTFAAGRGVDFAWEDDDVYGEAFAAVPRGGFGGEGGRTLMASGGMKLEQGRVGLVASDHDVAGGLGVPGGTTRSVGGRLELGARSDRLLRLEAGLMRVDPETGPATTGPAAEGELWLSDADGHLNVRGRLVPGQLPAGPTMSDQLFVGGLRRITGPLHATARASWASSAPTGGRRSHDFRRAEAGLRFSPRGLRLEGRFRVEEADVSFPVAGERVRRTAVLSADMPLGLFTVDGRAEIGHQASPRTEGLFRRLRGTLRWRGAGGWAFVSAGEESTLAGGSRGYVEGEGGWDLGRAELAGGASVEGAVFGGSRVRGWSRVAYRVTDGLSVVGGVERDALGASSDAWSVSLGVRQGLDVPLPLPESSVSHGVVFEDRDGDGRRDPGEEGLAGVRLRKGFVEVVSDARGRFEIEQEAVRRRALEVDPSTLPEGAIVTPGAEIPREGEAAVPVMRTAGLELELFLDRDGDGRRDEDEPPASGAVVTAVDDRGRERVAEADPSGRVSLTGLPPGPYTVRVHLPETRRRLAVDERFRMELAAGAGTARSVPLEPELRPVR